MSREQSYWLWGAASCVVLVLFAYFVVDRPVAIFVHEQFHGAKVFVWATHIVDPFLVLATVALVAVGATAIAGWELGRLGEVALRCSLSLTAAIILKDQLKYLFGRTWPETWIHNTPSYFGNGAFGFQPLHGGAGYESFPSGHMTEICTVMAVLWLWYPRLRWLYALLVGVVAIGLLGADYHWTSDIIAGSYLGVAVGIAGAKIGRGASQAIVR